MDGQDNSMEDLRVASFAAYLKPTDGNVVHKLTGGVPQPNGIFSPEETPLAVGLPRSKNHEESEIGVFGADKYFNMPIDYDTTSKAMKKEDPVQPYRVTPKLKAGTPSVISGSSYNSQTALFPSHLRNPSRNKQKKPGLISKGFFTGFTCSGPCLDKKSVHVDQVHRKEPRTESFRFVNPAMFDQKKQSQEHFAFPVLNTRKQAEDDPRYSIEVFGSHEIHKKGDIALNLERKLSMLKWDAIPKSQNTTLTTLGSVGPYDDIQSDASSDLFEIDATSGVGGPLFKVPLVSDNINSGCATPTTQYEPSEASIEWSVVTASAADFSVVSDYERAMAVAEMNLPSLAIRNTKSKIVEQKSRNGGLLGCKSHKAVSVAETAHQSADKARLAPLVQSSFASRAISS
ncbi:hypothetical protein NMG60_11004286 [Bertholletia excelsa]